VESLIGSADRLKVRMGQMESIERRRVALGVPERARLGNDPWACVVWSATSAGETNVEELKSPIYPGANLLVSSFILHYLDRGCCVGGCYYDRLL
jgi:hypothetical protein